MLPLPDNFRYLNREGRWLDFHWNGLDLDSDGGLQLLSSPKLIDIPPDFTNVAAPTAPAGIAVDSSGRIFFSVPNENKVSAVGGCSSDLLQLQCLPQGSGLCPLKQPRGLLLLEHPHRLVVVDSGNHRLLFFDPVTLDLRDVWGPDDVAANPMPSSAPGQFDTPWTVSADSKGNIYVLDYGNHRVQKFHPAGEPDLGFATRVQQSNLVPQPGALAVSGGGDANIFIFDTAAKSIYVFDSTGTPVRTPDGDPISISYSGMTQVLAMAASATTLYVGDNNLRRVLSFHLTAGFPFSGDAAGFDGPVAALAVNAPGQLFVSVGSNAQPLQMTSAGAYLPFGVLWSDAISSGKLPAVWNRLRAYIQNAPGAHIEFYYSISNSPAALPVDTSSVNPFADPAWKELPNDVDDFLLAGVKTYFLFVGAIFRGDRSASVRLTQMRADFDEPGYLPYLPVIYRQPDQIYDSTASSAVPSLPTRHPDADFLRRFLALFQGIFVDIEDEIDSLPRYFNPNAADPETLPWLASWLAVDIDQGEPVARIRSAIALAFQRYQWRGTAEGLRLALWQDAGIHANIVQPIANASFWSFPGDTKCSGTSSTPAGVGLGSTSTLPNMEPGGAVLGSTAELDHSYLITDAEFGEPLFDGTAYQFVVEVYRSEIDSQARLALVQEIVEREKPAHTMWRLSILDAFMSVGFQGRAGIDSIVAGTPGPSALGVASPSFGLRLAGQPAPYVGRSCLGENLKIDL
jgi:phage tail-like protein